VTSSASNRRGRSNSGITFKHLLLPVWMAAYRFRNRAWRVQINARTGEVQGERPYSYAKIAALIAAIVLVGVVIWLVSR
jgi:hypothetical protein